MKLIIKFLITIISVFLYSEFIYAKNTNQAFALLEKQINAGQYIQSYQRALQLRAFNEGNPRFDYLYGLSALQTGHYNEAIFALERVTASDPRVIRPRLELARAYLKLNNNKAALREFNTVLSLKPPKVVKQKVHQYISSIKSGGKGARKAVINGLLSLSFGFDDNINFGFENEDINLPLFGNITLGPASVQQESAFAETRLQLNYRKADSTRFNRFASAAITHRENFDNNKTNDFNLSSIDLRAGFTFNKDKHQYQLVFRNRPVALGNKLYTNTLGFDAVLRRSLGLGTVFTTGFALEDYDHKIESLRDRKRAIVSVKIDRKQQNNLHQVSAYVGKEDPKNEAGKAFSRDLLGVGYRLVKPWNAKNKSFFKLDYQQNQHQAAYPLYQEAREDDRISVKLGHEIRINKKLDLILSAQHINNDSNLELYDLSRNEIKAGIRYEWN